MKASVILFIFLFINADSIRFKKFIEQLPANWTYSIEGENLVMTRTDSVQVTYCSDMSPLSGDLPVYTLPYIITVESTAKLSAKQIKHRQFLQDSLQSVYQKEFETAKDKITYGKLEEFKITKNTIDSLRIPVYTDRAYSYYLHYNIKRPHCYVSHTVAEEIDGVNKRIRNLK